MIVTSHPCLVSHVHSNLLPLDGTAQPSANQPHRHFKLNHSKRHRNTHNSALHLQLHRTTRSTNMMVSAHTSSPLIEAVQAMWSHPSRNSTFRDQAMVTLCAWLTAWALQALVHLTSRSLGQMANKLSSQFAMPLVAATFRLITKHRSEPVSHRRNLSPNHKASLKLAP